MVPPKKRQSERVHVKLEVGVRGVDTSGQPFVDRSHTVQVSRGGAVIQLKRQLSPSSRLVLSRPGAAGKPQEATARVVERVGSDSFGEQYAVAFEESGAQLWGINFSTSSVNSEGVVRLLLICGRCDGREVAFLDEKQLEDFEAMRVVARDCATCGSSTLWRQAPEEMAEQRPAESRDSAQTVEERRKKRIPSHVNVCVRLPGSADEIAVCEDLSVGGLCFRSRKLFPKGARVEVAVPYVKGVSNIFVPARIVHVTEVPTAGIFRHGAAYIALPEDEARESSGSKS